MWTVVIGTGTLIMMGNISLMNFTLIRLLGTVLACVVAITGVYRLFKPLFHGSKLIRDRSLFHKQRTYGIRVMLGASASSLLGQVNQQFALYSLGAEQAGLWAYYLSFYTIVGVVINPLIGYLFPLLNELYKKKLYQQIKHLFKLFFGGIMLFGVI